MKMHPELQDAVDSYRKSRGFDPAAYLAAKTTLLNAYFSQSGIKSCVVGISGGVDSALVAALLAHALRAPGSPLQHVAPLLLPMHGEGATHQRTATSRGAEVCAALGLPPPVEADLSAALGAARAAVAAGGGGAGTPWSAGQLVSYLRTPALYYRAALLAEQGMPAVVCGTTNRDEGAYIGFFGKASDGMVDVQPISDLHKSEVYRLARLLGVPASVVEAVPTGDTYDGMCDEEMIGASYDFLELYEWFLCARVEEREAWLEGIGEDSKREFQELGARLEALHRKNKHKYIGDSPAVHLDVLDRAVPDGWRTQGVSQEALISRDSALRARVGPVELPRTLDYIASEDCRTRAEHILDFGDSAVRLTGALPQQMCRDLLTESDSWEWVEADVHGRKMVNSAEVGSYRATAFDEEFATYLWKRLSNHIPKFRTMSELTPTDHNNYPVWRPVGINPMLRFIRYESGGHLLPHYDSGFDFEDGRRFTLMSVVVTLTESAGAGGRTRFLVDRQRNLAVDERNFADWNCEAKDSDVLFEVSASAGDALVFDHRLLHDAPRWQGTGSRVILRTDLIFERCASHAISCPSRDSLLSTKLETGWAHDTTYRKAYQVLGTEEAIEHAGYFDDGLAEPPKLNSAVWTAPLGVLFDNLERSTDPQASLAVLVTTGSFCPLHVGHINMMQVARQTVERAGKTVLAGFLVPAHDSYVSDKCGPNALSAAQRVHLAEEAVRGSDWLVVDHWTALYSAADVNFTTAIDRIAAQLAHHLKIARSVEVVYVCGGDNARFALSFVARGACVVVSRPGFEESVESVRSHPAVCGNPRIHFADGETSPAASSAIRNGDMAGLPRCIASKYQEMTTSNGPAKESNFFMRHEGPWAVAHLSRLPGIDPTVLNAAYAAFCADLAALFTSTFSAAHARGRGGAVHVLPLDLTSQRTQFERLAQTAAAEGATIVSLDPCLPGALNLALSRCFAPLSTTASSRACTHVARPGAPPLAEQLACVKTGAGARGLVLFDDDSDTGATARAAGELLAGAGRGAERFVALGGGGADGKWDGGGRPRLDLVDCRDFLAGAREGGLVVWLPQWSTQGRAADDDGARDGRRWLCRAPYALPFVRPARRAGIPVEDEVRFSRRVWELNARFFAAVGGVVTVADAGDGFARLAGEWFGVGAGVGMGEFVGRVLEALPGGE